MSTTSTYVFNSAFKTSSEATRLDTLNTAFMEYFNGRLSLAPIEKTIPRNVLDLGCGTGAWAISAATYFPKADVVAVDINPIPPNIALPVNCHFMRMDILEPFPFQTAGFDIIHARLVLLHLADAESLLRRVTDILRPGGIIILEDPDNEGLASKSALIAALHKIMRGKKANPYIGREHARMLTDIGLFSEVHTKRLSLPLTRLEDPSIDHSVLKLAKAWKESTKTVVASLPAIHGEGGITVGMADQFIKDLDNPDADLVAFFCFTWARRKFDTD